MSLAVRVEVLRTVGAGITVFDGFISMVSLSLITLALVSRMGVRISLLPVAKGFSAIAAGRKKVNVYVYALASAESREAQVRILNRMRYWRSPLHI